MLLKFNCPKCGKEIIFKFLKREEKGKCYYCGQGIIIPSNAIEITEEPKFEQAQLSTTAEDISSRPYNHKQFLLKLLSVIILFTGLLVTGFGIIFFALSILILFIPWIIACIVFCIIVIIELFTGRGLQNITESIFGGLLLIIWIVIIVRFLPIYSLGWDKVERFEISSPREGWVIEITDQSDITVLKEFGRRGSYYSAAKFHGEYEIRVWQNGVERRYLSSNNNIRWPFRADVIQDVFKPTKKGLGDWLRLKENIYKYTNSKNAIPNSKK